MAVCSSCRQVILFIGSSSKCPSGTIPLTDVCRTIKNEHALHCRLLALKPETNAFSRTTTAVTMFNAGVKVDQENDGVINGGVLFENSLDMMVRKTFSSSCQVNMLPSVAEAFVNLRIHSAQSLQEVR